MPPIGVLLGGVDFSSLAVTIKAAPAPPAQEALLTEIRDLLRDRK